MAHTVTKTASVSPMQAAAPAGSFTIYITRLIAKLADDVMAHCPDGKHNQGRAIGEAYFWKALEKYAEIKYLSLMNEDPKKELGVLFSSGILPKRDTLAVGAHEKVAESPHFRVHATVSEPRKVFDPETLAKELSKRFKRPESEMLALIAVSRKPGNSSVTWKIEEIVS